MDSECGLAHLHTQNKFQNYKYPSNRIAPWHYHLSYIILVVVVVVVGSEKSIRWDLFLYTTKPKDSFFFYQTNSFLYKFIYKN